MPKSRIPVAGSEALESTPVFCSNFEVPTGIQSPRMVSSLLGSSNRNSHDFQLHSASIIAVHSRAIPTPSFPLSLAATVLT